MATIYRARVFHAPSNPFVQPGTMQYFEDGGVLTRDGRIVATGDIADVRRQDPTAVIVDHRPALIFPGFVDAHVHFPQLNVIGAMGSPLLDWLEKYTFPEEARLIQPDYARQVAQGFLKALLRNGTTAALVFGSHTPEAQETFFEEAAKSGLWIASGLNLADRLGRSDLRTTPQRAYDESLAMIRRWHGKGRLTYAVTPRFALGASEALLEACSDLLGEAPGILFQTHLNENKDEIEAVAERFPRDADYFAVYERFNLVNRLSVFAHNVHANDREIAAIAAGQASVAHCPSSNAFLGSGLFPLRRHVERDVRVALGSDVGAGAGFSLFQEGLMAYQAQMLRPDGFPLTGEQLLYLSTRAGAETLGLQDRIGDLTPGKSADLVVVDPLPGSSLEVVMNNAPSPERLLSAVFTLAREESVKKVYVAGEAVYERTLRRELVW